ncbi:hypothetical protein GCM10011507_20680 [Edaphobacter acidisoli]|uniref:Uncharacterized protein n=1 Tax=Edaphobacter acidisoli TaxID=2040573 RepID=A0A916RV74_9BACT|nr:hypothetical protein GCM10011507_20680 [Edaphobacter acidisoli]
MLRCRFGREDFGFGGQGFALVMIGMVVWHVYADSGIQWTHPIRTSVVAETMRRPAGLAGRFSSPEQLGREEMNQVLL